MAVVTPTPITSGMEKGPESIDQNFKSIAASINPELEATAWIKLPIASGVTTDTTGGALAQYRRKGSTVELTGMVGTGGAAMNIATLPVGFRPAMSVHCSPTCTGGTLTDVSRIFVETTGVIHQVTKMVNTSIWLDTVSFETNDDFPS